MSKVQLYVYDLSHGLAKSMSLMLTGKQIDGIWHTSVVAFGREIYYGQGVLESKPGATHHGQPLQIIDVGETHIDEATFNEYLSSLGEMYTPSKYHLIEFNCNHFTADVVGFLTGAEIPAWISNLPSEFLSTPFGQAMKPQIDAMFRGPTAQRPIPDKISSSNASPSPSIGSSSAPGGHTAAAGPSLASTLLQSVAAQATAQATGQSTAASGSSRQPLNPETSPLTLVSSTVNFHSILSQHSAVVVNFTNTPSCPPCRVIKPVYESIASYHSAVYGVKGARFVEVELGVGQGREIAGAYGVHATPTFIFFKDGKKIDEMKGAAKRELENKVEQFLEECYPTHPHRKMYLPAVEGLPKRAITVSNLPNYPALLNKLEGFLAGKRKTESFMVLKNEVVPFLEGKNLSETELAALLQKWFAATQDLLSALQPTKTFPLIDLWRIALQCQPIIPFLGLGLSTASNNAEPIIGIISLVSDTFASSPEAIPKPFILTVLRFLTNLTSCVELTNLVLAHDGNVSTCEQLISVLVESLLYPDVGVRSAAAGVAFNIGLWRHHNVVEETPSVDWELEMISGLVEALDREEDEDVAHRLLAALALEIYLSPSYEDNVQPMLQVLETSNKIEKRCKVWKRKEVKKLGEEIARKLC
ncbi:hypothetical protein J010_01890 [Cryptococcus neoformans]|nr:hypothetical protein C355_02020 [Cryptococcus neoformans var. grubii Th84]OXH14825.1 hypothetical protein J010_01890 [Cryptococcus neoformans var. grubii]OXH35600.1 hypothetical protein J009_01912 [Cryptococcus neoformans var. grubii]OXH55858.1 hypothetical protein J004_01981 [Cryptococcus neoformans var. grubii]OXH56074.1 hypothetical protein J003_01893 [Cryptococcus neoformans var. grubii]